MTDPAREALADPLEAAIEAYVWGYPLVVMHRTRALLCSGTGVGTMEHRDELATPTSRAVVAPNNDTLYSTGWYDLSAGDLTVEVPPMDHPGRYWNVMLLDAYSHVAYACRRYQGVAGTTVRVTLDPATEAPRQAATVIPMSTPNIWVLIRVLVDGPDDLAAARRLQRAISVTPLGDHTTERTPRLGRPNQVHTAGAEFFDELRAAVAGDPPAPWHPPISEPAWAVANGDQNLDDALLETAVEVGEARLVARGVGNDTTGNGWGTRLRGSDFGDDVLARAACAKYILAGHHPAENRAYIALADPDGAPLDGGRPLRLRFPPDGDPPCSAFWSLTVYDTDMFLVDNPIDRYAIGDRTPGLRRGPDGELSLTIGHAQPSDVSNWLPAPDGPYRLGLRVYEGHPRVVDATWFPPPLLPA